LSPPPKTTAAIAAEVGLSERTAQQRKQAANLDPLASVKHGLFMRPRRTTGARSALPRGGPAICANVV
jgi:hypothetical protein